MGSFRQFSTLFLWVQVLAHLLSLALFRGPANRLTQLYSAEQGVSVLQAELHPLSPMDAGACSVVVLWSDSRLLLVTHTGPAARDDAPAT